MARGATNTFELRGDRRPEPSGVSWTSAAIPCFPVLDHRTPPRGLENEFVLWIV